MNGLVWFDITGSFHSREGAPCRNEFVLGCGFVGIIDTATLRLLLAVFSEGGSDSPLTHASRPQLVTDGMNEAAEAGRGVTR